jgi:DNA-binding MurR/RpiR family transcriptional regulator
MKFIIHLFMAGSVLVGEKIAQTIKRYYASLSPGQRKVAEYIMAHMDEGALLTAFQIGKRVGVSETTVIRFAYALGFSGYSQMQVLLRKEWLSEKQMTEDIQSSVEQLVSADHLFLKVVEQETNIVQQLLAQLNSNDIWEAIDKIIRADKVYIGGFGSSYSAGYWLYYALKQLRENVFISSPSDFLLEDICDLTENSLVVIFSYPRYRRESLNLANYVREKNVKIIAVTNRMLSPIGQTADITLTTEEKMESGHHSIASVICLLEMIISGIQHRDQSRISKRQQQLELLYTNQGQFLE